ncbi:MAG: ABC transporter substrate-binding protein [Candidatus Gastranaerophilales bacterium]|nr:ABC transporter substrate-binding protein [Candidatus Gastranaerophilales bacterium]
MLIALVCVACFRIDKPDTNASDDNGKSAEITKSSEYRELKTLTINGTDYMLSRGDVGQYGGEFVTSTIGEGPKTFNPWESKDATSSQISDLMFDSLVTTDVYTGQVIPKLAKKIQVSKDNKTYTVTLRKGVKWSDGKEITADDVTFTWNKIILGGFGNISTRDSILIDGVPPEIKKIDKYTIKFTTPKPFAPFLRLMSVPIAPKHVFENVIKKGNRYFDSFYGTTTKPASFVTSGPFRLKEYVPAQRVVLVRNQNYYMIDEKHQKLPYIDRYIFLIVGDLNNELLKFESKELDILDLRGKDVARFKELENNSDYKVYNLGPNTGTMFLIFNMNDRKASNGNYYVMKKKQAWFRDKNFRTAVDYALDRDSMVFNIANGVGQPLFTAESLPSIYLNKKLEKGHKTDIEYSKKLLKQSGFYWDKKGILHDKKGNIVEFDLLTNAGNTEREAIGVMVKEDLSELGMKVNFKPIEFNSLVNKLTNSLDWESTIMGFTGNALEPHSGQNVWYSYGPLHLFNKRQPNEKNPNLFPWEKQIDSIFDNAALKLSFAERKKLYDQYQQIVYDERPIIYLYSPLRVSALRNKFGNIYPTQLGGVIHNPEEIYVKEDYKIKTKKSK